MPGRRQPKKRIRLSLERILDAALELTSAEGAQGLELRAIAKRVPCALASLYHYIKDSDDLRERLFDRVLGGVELPIADPAIWSEQLYAVACELRRAIVAHPAIAALIFHPAALGPNAQRVMEGLASIVQSGGLQSPIVPLAAHAICQLTAAFAVQDAYAQTTNDSDRSALEARMKRAINRLSWPSAEAEEAMVARIDEILEPNAAGFEFAVKTLIAGLRFQIPSALANEFRQIREDQKATIAREFGQLDGPEEQLVWLIVGKVVDAVFGAVEKRYQADMLRIKERVETESADIARRFKEHLAVADTKVATAESERDRLIADNTRLRAALAGWGEVTDLAKFMELALLGEPSFDYWATVIRRVHKHVQTSGIARLLGSSHDIADKWVRSGKIPKRKRARLERVDLLLRIRLAAPDDGGIERLVKDAEQTVARFLSKRGFANRETDEG